MSEIMGTILAILFVFILLGHRANSGENIHFPIYGNYKCEKVKAEDGTAILHKKAYYTMHEIPKE